MSLSGLCEICGATDVEHTCDRCGRLVCADHFEASIGYCVECAADVGGGGGDHVPSGEDLPDGVDVYRS